MTISRSTAYAMIALSSVAWSLGGLFVRVLALPPAMTIFWRAVVAGAFLSGLYLKQGRASFAILDRPCAAAAIILGTAAATILFILAVGLTSVAHVALIYATLPIVVTLLARWVLGEALSRLAIGAGLAILLGMTILMGDRTQGTGTAGDILALGMTLAMAIVTVAARRQTPSTLLPYYALANILVLAITPVLLGSVWPVPPAKFLGLLGFGVIQAGLGFWLAALAAPRLPAADTSVITTLEAPLGPVWVWLVLGETPSARSVIGGTIIVATVIVYVGVGAKSAANLFRSK